MSKFKWTAIFLIKGAADNTVELSQMLHEMAAVKKSDEVAVVMGINIRVGFVPALLPLPETHVSAEVTTDKPGWTTLFYRLESNPEGGCLFKFIHEKKDFKLGEEKDLTDFFKNQVLASFLADKYILFTWDHGQPFGIFPGANQSAVNGTMIETTEKISPLALHFRFAGELGKQKYKETDQQPVVTAIAEEAKELPILTITELRQAIEWAFGDEKIDVLVMSNCYLQFFDTGYELSDCVDYLIAFETEMFFKDAFDYKIILEAISNDPQLTPENLSKTIVSSYSMQRTRKNLASKNSVALFANNLSWYPTVAKLMDELAQNLINEMPRYREGIQRAVDKCEYISPNIPSFCLIDFRNFIRCLHNEIPSAFNVATYEIFEAVFRQLVTASYIGNDFVAERNARFVSPSCFSVYLPREIGDYQTSFLSNFMQETSLSPTAFVKRFRWESFINEFIIH
jgi:hypothetical protein